MSSKEQKTPEGQAPEEIITEQHDDVEAVEPEVSAEQVDPRDEKIANLEAQLAEAQKREREVMLRAKADEDNLRRRTEQDIEKAHKFALEKFVNELLPVIDSLDRALEVADKANPELAPMVEGIELTRKAARVTVEENRLTGNLYGIDVHGATDTILRGNVIEGRRDRRMNERGNGIYVWNAPGLLVEGKSNKLISRELDLSEATVKTHLSHDVQQGRDQDRDEGDVHRDQVLRGNTDGQQGAQQQRHHERCDGHRRRGELHRF